jgi:uncharacterized membrane protein YgdD (TMEM256/DUF423 family)
MSATYAAIFGLCSILCGARAVHHYYYDSDDDHTRDEWREAILFLGAALIAGSFA